MRYSAKAKIKANKAGPPSSYYLSYYEGHVWVNQHTQVAANRGKPQLNNAVGFEAYDARSVPVEAPSFHRLRGATQSTVRKY